MVLGPETVDIGSALAWYGDDDGLAVVHGLRRVLDEDPDNFAGVHPADADLLPGNLDGALKCRRLGPRSRRPDPVVKLGTAQARTGRWRERAAQSPLQLLPGYVDDVQQDAVEADADAFGRPGECRR
jgi:hypothetical protein